VTAAPTLEEILAAVLERARARERLADVAALESKARAQAARRRPLRAALERRPFSILAEIKRASPSAGPLRPDLDPGQIARQYAQSGAAALSVLTCEPWFRGSLADLEAARAACELPVLCKDFLVTPFQLVEAAAAGADAVLLLACALDDAALRELAGLASSLGLEVLFEAHDEAELERALSAGATFLGVNSRDLRTMAISRERALALGARLPPGVHGVFESGVRGGPDLRAAARAGFRSALVGESLLRSPSPGAKLRALLAEAAAP
jgi:indole-3-glycerol phosphate synthase